MRYISPALLTNGNLSAPYDRKSIQRERKRLLADLQLSDGGGLVVNGEVLDQNDILGYFEQLEREEVVAYHTAIAQDPVLLGFLQDGTLGAGERFGENRLYAESGFTGWVSDYFFIAALAFAGQCLAKGNELGMYTLFQNRLLMTENDKERTFRHIAGTLARSIHVFNLYARAGAKGARLPVPWKDVLFYLGHTYIQVIRALPDAYFGQVKDQYAFAIMHPSIAFFNNRPSDRSIPIVWVEDALSLAPSEHVRHQIGLKLDELKRLEKKTGRKFYPIGIIVWLAIMIFQFVGSSSNDNSFTPPTEVNPTQVQVVNSLIKKIDSSKIRVVPRETKEDTLLYKPHQPREPTRVTPYP